MQTLLIPASRGGAPPLSLPSSGAIAVTRTLQSTVTLPQLYGRSPIPSHGHKLFLSPPDALYSSSSSMSSLSLVNTKRTVMIFPRIASASTDFSSSASESDQAKLAQVAKRLEKTARYFKKLGSFGFWGQLIFTVVAAAILSCSIVFTGKVTSPFTFYATSAGIAAGFISVFWSFGYLRLAERLRKTANQPSKAPPRADVVKSLKNGIVVNLLGMGAAILGTQATVGLLVGKALTSSANPFYQGISPGYSPVLALDVFLVQASANIILSHFLGLASSLELLRSVTLQPTQAFPVPKAA